MAKCQEEWYCPVSHGNHFLGFAVIISQSETGVYDVLPHWVLGEVDSKVGTLRFVVVWLLNKLQKLRGCYLICLYHDKWFWDKLSGLIMYFEFLMLLLKIENNLDIHTILTAIVIHSIEVELLRPICNLNRKIITQASLALASSLNKPMFPEEI